MELVPIFEMVIYQERLVVPSFYYQLLLSKVVYHPNLSWDNSLWIGKADEFVRPPNRRKHRILIETKKTTNAIWSQAHRILSRDHFLDPFGERKSMDCETFAKLQHSLCVA